MADGACQSAPLARGWTVGQLDSMPDLFFSHRHDIPRQSRPDVVCRKKPEAQARGSLASPARARVIGVSVALPLACASGFLPAPLVGIAAECPAHALRSLML